MIITKKWEKVSFLDIATSMVYALLHADHELFEGRTEVFERQLLEIFLNTKSKGMFRLKMLTTQMIL